MDYYFSYSTYHSRWEELERDDFTDSDDEWMGYNIYSTIVYFDPLDIDVLEADPIPIFSHNEEVLYDFLDYCTFAGKRYAKTEETHRI